jgi:hypothetical protein
MMVEQESNPIQPMASAARLSQLFGVDEDATIDSVRREIDVSPEYPGGHVSVHIVPVHTFILQDISKDAKLSRGILVPSFASHWGVITGEPGSFTLYHLVFVPDTRVPQKDNSDTIKGRRREVKFNFIQWPPNGTELNSMGMFVSLKSESLRILIKIWSKLVRFFIHN